MWVYICDIVHCSVDGLPNPRKIEDYIAQTPGNMLNKRRSRSRQCCGWFSENYTDSIYCCHPAQKLLVFGYVYRASLKVCESESVRAGELGGISSTKKPKKKCFTCLAQRHSVVRRYWEMSRANEVISGITKMMMMMMWVIWRKSHNRGQKRIDRERSDMVLHYRYYYYW